MTNLFNYPRPFWEHANYTYASYQQEEKDGEVITKISLPGKTKEDVEIKHSADENTYTLIVNGHEYGWRIYLPRQINSDAIEAKLELGVLTLTAPILNQDKTIQIK